MTGPGDVVDAFLIFFEDPSLVFRPVTTRAYQQQVKAVIGRKLQDGELSQERGPGFMSGGQGGGEVGIGRGAGFVEEDAE